MDELIDASDNEPEPPLLPIEPVEIVPSPNFENLVPVIPLPEDEVPYEDLLGDLNAPMLDQQDLQVAYAQMFYNQPTESFYSSVKPSPEAIRQWAKHFSQGATSLPSVIIPDCWMNFFTLLLLQSPTFDWAKDFLQSPAWNLVSGPHSKSNSSVFCIPSKCPDAVLHTCFMPDPSSLVIEEIGSDTDEGPSSSKSPVRAPKTPKGKGKQPVISEAELRRSLRVKKLHKGFKTSCSKGKSCLGCEADPPTLSASVIRDLGVAFCNVDPDDLTEEKLGAKPKLAVKKNAKKAGTKKPPQPPKKGDSD
jgi:hypothetical protein